MTRIRNQRRALAYHGVGSVPSVLTVVGFVCCLMLPLRAAESTSLAEQNFKRIAEKQRELFAEAAKQGDKLDEAGFKAKAQELVHDYEIFLRGNPKHAAGHAAYGYLLGKVGMRQEAAAILLKANQLDPDIALVKNQLGNHLAEEGRPREAVNYFLAAIKLEPNEPLYHYQLGTLLAEARDDFLKGGEWTRAGLDQSMRKAFERATELAPDRFEFAYRYAECFYDLATPDWETALKLWAALEEKAPTPIERQTMRLHAANVLLKMGRREHARSLLGTVDDPALQKQKQKLVAQLAETPKK